LEGPQTGAQSDNLSIEVWNDTDGDHATWDPGTLLGTSTNNEQLANNAVSFFNFSGVTLADNTVYTLRVVSDDANQDGSVRFGLVGSFGAGDNYADGTLFQGGQTVFGDNFDASFSVTTVPSGGSTALMMGAGLLGLAGVKRKLR
jgi:hypothetical protein